MKKTILFAAAAAALAMLASSCKVIRYDGSTGTGNTVDEKGSIVKVDASKGVETKDFGTIGEFNTLVLNVPAEVRYTQGDYNLQMTSYPDVLDNIVVRYEDNCMIIEPKKGKRFNNVRKFDINLGYPGLESVVIHGAGDFKAETDMAGTDCSFAIYGAGEIDLGRLTASSVEIEVNGAGDVSIEDVECASLDVSINGAGDCSIAGHVSERASASIHGTGEIDLQDLRCDGSVSSSVSGLGVIRTPHK